MWWYGMFFCNDNTAGHVFIRYEVRPNINKSSWDFTRFPESFVKDCKLLENYIESVIFMTTMYHILTSEFFAVVYLLLYVNYWIRSSHMFWLSCTEIRHHGRQIFAIVNNIVIHVLYIWSFFFFNPEIT